MYEIKPANKKTEKKINEYKERRNDIYRKLEALQENPREANAAHPLKGRLAGKWACWLGSNIRIVYFINEENKWIEIENIGTHKIY